MTTFHNIDSEDVVLILKSILYGHMRSIELMCANNEDYILNDENEEPQRPNNINEVIDMITHSMKNISINFNKNLNKYKDQITAKDLNKTRGLFDETIGTLKI